MPSSPGSRTVKDEGGDTKFTVVSMPKKRIVPTAPTEGGEGNEQPAKEVVRDLEWK